jgi:hypothetical protein
MPVAFRETPPLELVKRFLEIYGIYDIDMCTWFTKDQCALAKASDLLVEIQPYYIPCKATFIEVPSYDVCIKVLRHLLKPYGYTLSYMEKSRGGKQTWYKVSHDRIPIHNMCDGEIRFE